MIKVAINKEYKYLTFEENCPKDLVFEEWVMQPKYKTHSIVEISAELDKDKLRFNQFDYDESSDSFTFNADTYNQYAEELEKPQPPTGTERLEELENILNRILLGEV